jgi:hypothetical protein
LWSAVGCVPHLLPAPSSATTPLSYFNCSDRGLQGQLDLQHLDLTTGLPADFNFSVSVLDLSANPGLVSVADQGLDCAAAGLPALSVLDVDRRLARPDTLNTSSFWMPLTAVEQASRSACPDLTRVSSELDSRTCQAYSPQGTEEAVETKVLPLPDQGGVVYACSCPDGTFCKNAENGFQIERCAIDEYLSKQPELRCLLCPDGQRSFPGSLKGIEDCFQTGATEDLDATALAVTGAFGGLALLWVALWLLRLRKRHPEARHVVPLIALLGVYDLATDVLFSVSLAADQGADEEARDALQLAREASILFLVLPLVANIAAMVRIVVLELKQPRFQAHFNRHSLAMMPVLLLSATHVGCLELFDSKLFGLPLFACPFSPAAHRALRLSGLISNIFEDIPQ